MMKYIDNVQHIQTIINLFIVFFFMQDDIILDKTNFTELKHFFNLIENTDYNPMQNKEKHENQEIKIFSMQNTK